MQLAAVADKITLTLKEQAKDIHGTPLVMKQVQITYNFKSDLNHSSRPKTTKTISNQLCKENNRSHGKLSEVGTFPHRNAFRDKEAPLIALPLRLNGRKPRPIALRGQTMPNAWPPDRCIFLVHRSYQPTLKP